MLSNGKQERFFGVLEGRLMAMLENYAELTLVELNEATMAWVELEYQQAQHEEIGTSPIARFQNSQSVNRPSPSSAELKLAFRRDVPRRQRRTDGTLSLEGKHFEIPAHYRQLTEIRVRYARWDLRSVHLVDRNGNLLCPLYPQDKVGNASGLRRSVSAAAPVPTPVKGEPSVLLKELMAEYAATGLPPAYLPKDEQEE